MEAGSTSLARTLGWNSRLRHPPDHRRLGMKLEYGNGLVYVVALARNHRNRLAFDVAVV
jgi:hypothetical protein